MRFTAEDHGRPEKTERAVVVEGERWVRIDDECELAVYSYEDVAEKWGWAVPLRCPSR